MSAQKNAESPEMVRFNDELRQVMRVTKSDLQRLLSEDKVTHLVPQKRGRKPKTLASFGASSEKD